jgi:delta 1-pyrroline-5-carboxylate dehydrogenase
MNFHVARIFVLALCLLLTGCDSTRFLYNRADWLLGFQANRYLDLDTSQKSYVKVEIDRWFGWHRRTQLVCYAELIDEFEARARMDLTSDDITWLESEVMGHYENLITTAIQPAAYVLSDLDGQQITHLEKRLAKDRAKLARELSSKFKTRQQRRTKKTVAGIKKWFGKLSRAQVAWISARSQQLPDAYAPWLEYRAQRDGSLIKLLRSQPDAETITSVIEQLWTSAETSMAADTEKLMEEMKAQSKTMAVDFYNTATVKQKTHFWNRLRGYRNDFLLLAKFESSAGCDLPTIRVAAKQISLLQTGEY